MPPFYPATGGAAVSAQISGPMQLHLFDPEYPNYRVVTGYRDAAISTEENVKQLFYNNLWQLFSNQRYGMIPSIPIMSR